MKVILIILLLLYGAATLGAVWSEGRSQLGKFVLMLIGAVALLLGLFVPVFVPIGILLLLAAAILNGLRLHGTVDYRHLTIRLIVSLIIMLLWWGVYR